MILVVALNEANGAQRVTVIGTEVLKGAVVDGTALHPQLTHRLDHSVTLERLLLLVPLKVPGAQRHLTPQTGLQSHRLFIYAVVTENLQPLGFGLRVHVLLRCSGLETLDDAAEFKVFLQGIQPLELCAALGATGKRFVIFVGNVSSHVDAGSAVAVSTGKNHRIAVHLETDGAAQLIG